MRPTKFDTKVLLEQIAAASELMHAHYAEYLKHKKTVEDLAVMFEAKTYETSQGVLVIEKKKVLEVDWMKAVPVVFSFRNLDKVKQMFGTLKEVVTVGLRSRLRKIKELEEGLSSNVED